MVSNPQLLIHIGYPKTASGWLQNGLIKDETLGFLAPWGSPSAEAIEQFVIPNTFRFSAESVRRVFEPGLEEAARRKLVPVLSHEHLGSCGLIIYQSSLAELMNTAFLTGTLFLRSSLSWYSNNRNISC